MSMRLNILFYFLENHLILLNFTTLLKSSKIEMSTVGPNQTNYLCTCNLFILSFPVESVVIDVETR